MCAAFFNFERKDELSITNRNRAEWAKAGLSSYSAAKGGYEPNDETAILLDFLGDLMHLAEREEIDFENCARIAEMHYDAERREEANAFGLLCPECKTGDQIDIQASVWIRLCPDGTDVTAAANGDHEWNDDDAAVCAACGHEGTVKP